MRVLKVAKHIYSDNALRDRGNCQEPTHRLSESITLSLIEEFLGHFVPTSISVSYESIYNGFERSGYFLSFYVASMSNIVLTPWALLFSSVQLLSHVRLCDPMECRTPGPLSITNSRSLLKLMSIESVMPSNHLILCHPLLLPSIFPRIRVFSNESALRIRWPKYYINKYKYYINKNTKNIYVLYKLYIILSIYNKYILLYK